MKSFQWTIRSEDRISGPAWDATFDVPIPFNAIETVDFLWFRGFNTLPNVTDANNTLVVDTTLLGQLICTFPATDMGPLVGGNFVSGEGLITQTQATTTVLFENDIRFVLLRQFPDLDYASLNPTNGRLYLGWSPAVGLATYNVASTATWLHLQNNAASLLWFADDFMDLGGPTQIALSSPDLYADQNQDTKSITGANFLAVIPVEDSFLEPVYYEPVNPIRAVVTDRTRTFGSFNIRIVDPLTRLMVPMTRWSASFGIIYRN